MADDLNSSFPCEIPIKIFGRNAPGFRDTAVGIVRSHYDSLDESRIRQRSSGGGKYLSLTIVVHAESRAEIDAVYRDLTEHDDIVMVL